MAIGSRSTRVAATEAPTTTQQVQIRATPPIEVVGLQGVAPTMIASLPDMASGADVYMRQFYRGSRLPFRRYLPIRSQ